MGNERDEEKIVICIVACGICPKPVRTYGEPHYCDRILYHKEPHHCPNCKMEYEADETTIVQWQDYEASKRRSHDPA